MQPMMQPMMDQLLDASQDMQNSQVQDCMDPANQFQEPSAAQDSTEIQLIPKTPELTPETPPEVPDSPLLDQEPEDVLAPTPNWAVTIKNQSGTESVVGPVWVACVMISSLEFVHPESQRPLSETELNALEKVLPMCDPKPPSALKLTRAYELSRTPARSAEEAQELKKMQATANDELEALRAQAAETTQRDQPEATGDVAQLLTDAQNAISLQSAVDNGWVTKSAAKSKPPKTSTTLCPYSRKFVTALQDSHLVAWLQKVEEQLDVVVKSTANMKARPTAQFPNLTAKKRGMLHEVCTHFGLDCVGENDKSAASKMELRPMTVTWTEFACCPRCLPSKASNALGSERASLNDFQTPTSHNFTHAVYLPDSSVDEIQERVKADVPEGTSVQVHHLGARHVVVEFEDKLSAQKFLRPFRSESTLAEWWSGDIAFGKWQFEQRAKHDSRSSGK